MKKKVLLAGVLSACMILSLAGCGSGGSDTGTTAAAAGGRQKHRLPMTEAEQKRKAGKQKILLW